ncbi:MAG: hypothetical protein JWP82_925 [Humibacillus sp.]|nr:hypothetical protein [Humibacillus sp.]
MPFVVQFPHPGSEHRPSPAAVDTVMPHNRGDHKRKFLRADATYLEHGRLQTGDVAFWGEWEPPSRVIDVWSKQARLPRFLHEPLFDLVPEGVKHQNTDPLVLGEQFLFTNCRQARQPRLRELTPGSLVLFGSGQGPGFVLDTVFVVGDDEHPYYEIGERDVVPGRPDADALVFRPLASSPKHLGKPCRAYRGRPHEPGDDRPFSFVPCRPVGPEVRFERPLLRPEGPLEGLINPLLRMAARVEEVDEQTVQAVWEHVRGVVESERLSLGVRLAGPQHTALDLPLAEASGRGC